MSPRLRIILSILFVGLVALFSAKVLIPRWRSHPEPHPQEKMLPSKKRPSEKPSAARPERPSRGPKMAIILDDWGRSLPHVDEVSAIGEPMTLAVIPHLPHSLAVAKRAHEKGLGVMLHMPMEPKSRRQPTEPHTIRVSSTDEEIRRYLTDAFKDVGYAEGMNNHQGSAATSDARVMRTVMEHLKKHQLFFVDSQVIASSVGAKTARQMGVPFTKRNVFIDNQPTVEAVMERLEEGARFAREHGQVVVIGHDKSATIEAIRRSAPKLKREGIVFVKVTELLEKP